MTYHDAQGREIEDLEMENMQEEPPFTYRVYIEVTVNDIKAIDAADALERWIEMKVAEDGLVFVDNCVAQEE